MRGWSLSLNLKKLGMLGGVSFPCIVPKSSSFNPYALSCLHIKMYTPVCYLQVNKLKMETGRGGSGVGVVYRELLELVRRESLN
jgi:hypothetical protein